MTSTGTGMCAACGYVYGSSYVAGGPTKRADRGAGRADRGGLLCVTNLALTLVRWT
jgi:hypothetical protein